MVEREHVNQGLDFLLQRYEITHRNEKGEEKRYLENERSKEDRISARTTRTHSSGPIP